MRKSVRTRRPVRKGRGFSPGRIRAGFWVHCGLFALVMAGFLGILPSAAVAAPATTVTTTAPATATSGQWRWPVSPGIVLRGFDGPAQPWLAGHRGVDLAAVRGQAVVAPEGGRVSFAGTVVDRPVLTIAGRNGRKSSLEPVTTTLRAGARVEAGDVVGTVAGGASHCTGRICLHWGVREHGDYVDPLRGAPGTGASILLPDGAAPDPDPPAGPGGGSAPGGWGGQRNGRIPAEALCPIPFAPRQRLRCDAAAAVARLDTAFRRRFGRDLAITDAYRDLATQILLKRIKPRLAAAPGHSNHGWGLAIDFGGGINSFGSPEHLWMKAHAAESGWVHPAWAEPGGSMPEPWHWEFAGAR